MFELLILLLAIWLLVRLVSVIRGNPTREIDRLRRELEELRAAQARPTPAAEEPPSTSDRGYLAPGELENLLLLRLDLQRLADAGRLSPERLDQLVAEVDRLWARHLSESVATPEGLAWQRRRAAAWERLVSAAHLAPEPPWHDEVARAEPAPRVPAETPRVAAPVAAVSVDESLTAAAPPPAGAAPVSDLAATSLAVTTPEPASTAAVATETWVEPPFEPAPLWQPTAPDRLERALLALSGWPKLIVPFLAQNVGWLIGGFCLVAGILFLIAYTSGFVNALLVFGSLLGTTALLFWGGYQLRHQRPELIVASSMLLTLGMLLGPLDLVVAVRLIDASGGNLLLILLSLLLAAGTLGAFAFAATLASALLDPALQGRYPRLLTLLAGLQLAAPLAWIAGGWPVLAVLHALLLVLLGYALRSFIDQWLRRIFVDQRATTYFAAGLLVYTALVSFTHLTWVWPQPLPVGYLGLFLMALCVLLLPVDAAFKEWVHKSVFLSRFTFAIYGLSAVAVAMAAPSIPAVLPTLALGAGLYGWMTWKYRTWPPLYLLFACLSGLYGLGILHQLPPAWHALASLPGLLALLGLGHWARPRSRGLALQCLLTLGLLLVGLTVWSLFWTERGELLGAVTAAASALLLYASVRLVLELPDADPRWALGDAALVVLATTALAYVPDWLAFGSVSQTVYGLLMLATLWTWLGLHGPRPIAASRRIFVTSALASLALALGLAGLGWASATPGRLEPILLMTLAGALLLWLALALRQRVLIYAVLACAGAVGLLVKRTWFPGPPTGLVDFSLVVVIWSLLWRMERRARLRQALGLATESIVPAGPVSTHGSTHSAVIPAGMPGSRPGIASWQPRPTVSDLESTIPSDRPDPGKRPKLAPDSANLARLGALLRPAPNLPTLIRVPLEQAMVLMWALGLLHLGQGALTDPLPWSWPGIAALAAATAVLVVGHVHRFRWTVLPLLLALASLLVGSAHLGLTLPWLGALGVLATLLLWRWSSTLLDRPIIQRLATALCFTVPGGAGGRRQVEETLSTAALLIATVPVVASPALVLLGVAAPQLLPTLASSLLLLMLTAWSRGTRTPVWTALAALSVSAWVTGSWLAPPDVLALGQPLINLSLSLGLIMSAHWIRTDSAAPLLVWRAPLQRMSLVLYLLTLVGAVLAAQTDDPLLPLLLGLLCLVLFPVSRPLTAAAAWRGLGLALLASALVWSLTESSAAGPQARVWIAVGWGYLLLLVGNLLLPVWNRHRPGWSVSPSIWPLLGLVCGVGGLAAGVFASLLLPATALAGLASFLFLLLGNTVWPGVAWLAVMALAASGLVAAGALDWAQDARIPDLATDATALMLAALWTNLLLLLVPIWRRFGRTLARGLAWRQEALDRPLVSAAVAILALLLVLLLLLLLIGAIDLLARTDLQPDRVPGPVTGLALLIAITAAHALRSWSVPLVAQLLLIALAAILLALVLDLELPLDWLPLVAALWYSALVLAARLTPPNWEVWQGALRPWPSAWLILSLGLLMPWMASNWVAGTTTLLLLALATVARGWWDGTALWIKTGMVLMLTASYSVWLALLALSAPLTPLAAAGLLPWYALQTALLLLALSAIRQRLQIRASGHAEPTDALASSRLSQITEALTELSSAVFALTLMWLGLHVWLLLLHQLGLGPALWGLGPTADALMAGAAMLVLVALGVARAWRRPQEPRWVYATALLLMLLIGYARLVLLGLAPFTPWDTAALLAAAAVAFILSQLTHAGALVRLGLLLPLLAVATAPWQLASSWTGASLLASALLYLSMAGRLRNPWPSYLGVLALNGAVYLWAPLWAERFELWQLNIIPAATSVLVLLHLHRRELRPRVLHGGRLAALSTLYAGAGLDLFLRPDLLVFVLALGLALIGILLGIALRIRAFLYLGISFLVLNVSGQLIRYYPEPGLARALILIGLGLAITGAMLVFNLKRESILRRIRIARADLARWD